jgi:hypothetical protein
MVALDCAVFATYFALFVFWLWRAFCSLKDRPYRYGRSGLFGTRTTGRLNPIWRPCKGPYSQRGCSVAPCAAPEDRPCRRHDTLPHRQVQACGMCCTRGQALP